MYRVGSYIDVDIMLGVDYFISFHFVSFCFTGREEQRTSLMKIRNSLRKLGNIVIRDF